MPLVIDFEFLPFIKLNEEPELDREKHKQEEERDGGVLFYRNAEEKKGGHLDPALLAGS